VVTAVLLGVIVGKKRLQTTPDRVYEERPPASILAASPLRFHEEAAALGMTYRHSLYYPNPVAGSYLPLMALPPAIAVADFDGDGFEDVYVVQPDPARPNALYENDGGTRFVDVAHEVGLDDAGKRFPGSMALWVDLDGDGRLDLFQSRFGCHSLFVRDAGALHFTAHPERAGRYCSNPKAVNVADFDRDGRLDLVFGNYYPETDLAGYLPLNHVFGWAGANFQGGGLAILFGTPVGLSLARLGTPPAHTTAVGVSDVNDDGWPDLFASNDYTFDQMLVSHEGRRFTDVTESAIPPVEHGLSGMDGEFADFDNAGAMSLFVSNMYFPPFSTVHDLLWKKTGPARFTNVADAQGVARCGWAWTAKFADFDDSGDLDLFVVNGKARGARVTRPEEAVKAFAFVRNTIAATPPSLREQMSLVPDFSRYYLSAFERSCVFWQKDGHFYDVAPEAGVTDLEEGQAAALVDFDNDGRMDVVVANVGGPLLFYRNVSSPVGHWLGVSLVGPAGMSVPYGAKAWLHRNDGKAPMRELYPANGFRGQNDPRLHFGLGAATRAGDLEVRWPDGKVEHFADLPIDRYVDVRYGEGAAR
jgi:hypothetical protein